MRQYLSNIPFFSSIGARPSRTVPQLVLYCGYFSLLGVRPLSSMSFFVSRQRWSSPWDSNRQPAAYKAAALPIEPEEHVRGRVLIGSTRNPTSTNEAERPSLPPLFILPRRRSSNLLIILPNWARSPVLLVASLASEERVCYIRDYSLPFLLG